MDHKRMICAVLLVLTMTFGVTACGGTGSADSGSADAAESSAESSAGAVDKAARPTADGIYISNEGLLKVPEEITLKGTKTTVSKTLDEEGVYRIQAVTGEIDGLTYTVCETGVVPATYVRVINEHDNAYMFGISGHAVAAEHFPDGTADYVVNISPEQCIRFKVTANGIDEKTAEKRFEKAFQETAELYDTLINDLVDQSEIKWD